MTLTVGVWPATAETRQAANVTASTSSLNNPSRQPKTCALRRIGLLSPTLSSRGGEGEAPASSLRCDEEEACGRPLLLWRRGSGRGGLNSIPGGSGKGGRFLAPGCSPKSRSG